MMILRKQHGLEPSTPAGIRRACSLRYTICFLREEAFDLG